MLPQRPTLFNERLQSFTHRINYAAPIMYAVISDIHGNLEALEAVLRDVPEGVETIYCLGDVIGYGASPNECCDVVREWGMPVISGNHDLAVTDLSTDLNWFNPVAAAAVEWTREHLSEENAEFLRTRPRTMQSEEALFVHGSVRDPDEYIINAVSAQENLAILKREYPGVPICFFGHTHVKTVAPSPNGSVIEAHTLDLSANGPYLVNPGSVGQPRDGDTFASYVLAEGRHVSYRFVEYDIEGAQAKIREAGLPGMLADRLAVGR
ncbi:MAG: metallophosphatase family protein [Actinomycetota bacterium]|jgi:predicted phosphodiesterase|nr:metallophosphatase family protein [Actinomycetota bacterium]